MPSASSSLPGFQQLDCIFGSNLAADRWIFVWRAATFVTDEYYRECIARDRYYVDRLLERFGSELVRLGRDFRATQAGALAKASVIVNWMARVALDFKYECGRTAYVGIPFRLRQVCSPEIASGGLL